MQIALSRSLLAASLVIAMAWASAFPERAGAQPAAPQAVGKAPLAMPHLQPLRPTAEWTGIVLDLKLQAVAPPAKQPIRDAATWAALWHAWRGKEKLPEVNFKEERLFVFTAIGPNIPFLRLYHTGNSVTGTVGQTVKGGPGFGYRIIKLPRQEMSTFLGQPVK